tara:strand:+ start:17807 stop:18277 length:471 start_codon:yes stop_codon:yes gene_type:complete
MWLLIAFIAIPLIEIALFIQVGGFIGLWPTLGIVLGTAILGSSLVRSQGARELSKLQGSFASLSDPTEPLANGAMIIFAGALLLTPGFFTDAVGFALLFPPFRAAAFKYAKSKIKVQQFSAGPQPQQPQGPADQVIDGDFKVVKPTDNKPSGWTRD